MPSIPEAMKRHGRPVDVHFIPAEQLFRRVPPDLWEDPAEDFDIEAIELPDMSVVWGKYGHPEWARFDRGTYTDWGVIGFAVQHIPPSLTNLGIFVWRFAPYHAPEGNNYPHTEIRAFENGVHIDMRLSDRIDPNLHLRWREHLVRQIAKVIHPQQEVVFRESFP
jgi:hypothetical protein